MNFVNTNLTIYTLPSPENKKAAAPLKDCSFIIHKQYLFVTIQHPYSQPLRGCFMWRSEALRALPAP